jgi:hypothetical protein
MDIIITESQLNKIVDEIKYVSKDQLLGKESEDKIEFNVVGVYGIKDMNELSCYYLKNSLFCW